MQKVNIERFKKQLDFILEIDKEKEIYRQTHLTEYKRQENDAEHAWHMAIMIYLLREYANEEFDLAKAMMMALIHDTKSWQTVRLLFPLCFLQVLTELGIYLFCREHFFQFL